MATVREAVDSLLTREILSPELSSFLMKRNVSLSECLSLSVIVVPDTLFDLCDPSLFFDDSSLWSGLAKGDLPFKKRDGEQYGSPIDFLRWAIKAKWPILEPGPGYSELMRVLGYPELAISNEWIPTILQEAKKSPCDTATETPADRVARIIDAHPDGIFVKNIAPQISDMTEGNVRTLFSRHLRPRGYWRKPGKGYMPPKKRGRRP